MGPSKGGKSSSILLTCPQPVIVINGDGKDALVSAKNLGAEFTALRVTDNRTWSKAVNYACDLVEAGEAATVVVDTITLVMDTLYEELREEMALNWDFWQELYDRVMDSYRALLDIDAHLFVVAHHIPSSGTDDDVVGIMPAIPGKAKSRIPAMVNDWIWLDVNTKKDPIRGFLLGPQKNWSGSGRNIKGSKRIPADVGVLFEELGIKP